MDRVRSTDPETSQMARATRDSKKVKEYINRVTAIFRDSNYSADVTTAELAHRIALLEDPHYDGIYGDIHGFRTIHTYVYNACHKLATETENEHIQLRLKGVRDSNGEFKTHKDGRYMVEKRPFRVIWDENGNRRSRLLFKEQNVFVWSSHPDCLPAYERTPWTSYRFVLPKAFIKDNCDQ